MWGSLSKYVGGVENTNNNGKSDINLVEKHCQGCTESAKMDMNYQKIEKEFSLHFYTVTFNLFVYAFDNTNDTFENIYKLKREVHFTKEIKIRKVCSYLFKEILS